MPTACWELGTRVKDREKRVGWSPESQTEVVV
jgi:hypothetical protein